MRKLLFILCLLPVFSFAQTVNLPMNGNNMYEYTGRVIIQENKTEIFKRLQEWLAVRKFGAPVMIKAENNRTFSTKLAENNYDYIDTVEHRIRGTGYIEYSPSRPYMYVIFDYQLIASDGKYTFDFKRFNVILFRKGRSMKEHSFNMGHFSAGGGNMSDAKSEVKSLEQTVYESEHKRQKIVRQQNMQDVEYFNENMNGMINQLKNTVNGLF